MDTMDELADILNRYVSRVWTGSVASSLSRIEKDADKIQSKFFRQLYTLGLFKIRHTYRANSSGLQLPNDSGLNVPKSSWESFSKDHFRKKKKYGTENLFFRYKGQKGKSKRFKALNEYLMTQDPKTMFGKPSVALVSKKRSGTVIKKEQLNRKGNVTVKAFFKSGKSIATKDFELYNDPITSYAIEVDLYPKIPQDYTEQSIAAKLRFSTPVVKWKLYNSKVPRYFMARYMEWYAERYVAQRLLRKVS